MPDNDLKKLTIDSVAYGAKGIGRCKGKVIFVPGALEGEKVLVRVIKEYRNYTQAGIVDILDPSPYRIPARCPHYGVCGGCNMQHVRYPEELRYKKKQVEDILRRIGGQTGFCCEEIQASAAYYGYRQNLTLHSDPSGRCGFFSAGSRVMIYPDQCPVATRALNSLFKNGGIITRGDGVTIKSDSRGRVWRSDTPGHRFFQDVYMGEGLYFSPKCFSQVNRDIACETAAAITSWAKDMDPGTSFFDLYCGNGFFSFLLKGPFRNRVGVENDRIAISCAGSAKKERGEEWPRFYRGRAEEVFPGLYEKYSSHSNAVLVDPPRSGMHGSLVNFLSSERSIDRIYYLSCDPSTMARDIRGLCAETGYRLTRIRPFDMFPRTAHIEVLAELVRE